MPHDRSSDTSGEIALARTASVAIESRNQHRLGIVLTLTSAIAYSTAGFFTRLINLDTWTILFWRAIFAGLLIGGVIVWQHRRSTLAAFRTIGAPGLVAASLSTLATIMIINAFRRTSVTRRIVGVIGDSAAGRVPLPVCRRRSAVERPAG